MTSQPQELAERALEASTADGCVVLVTDTTSANLRWANNTLTTNGVAHRLTVSVVSVVDGHAGRSAGSATGSATTPEQAATLVAAAEAAARGTGPAEDAADLVPGEQATDWGEPAPGTSVEVYRHVAPALGEAFSRAEAEQRILYGFVYHEVATTYLATSSGLRRRHVQPTGHIAMTGKPTDLSGSAWVGAATRDFTDVDPLALDAELARRLGWGRRRVDLPAGRYDTVLPPTAVADLMIYAYWSAGAREAHEGRSVFARPGGGTRIGERLSRRPVMLWSDPWAAGLEAAPFLTAAASSDMLSVFDNGLPLTPTRWVDDGRLSALVQTRHTSRLTGQPATLPVDNLALGVADATGTAQELAASMDSGLLLTCLWYIRVVDPQTLLLTGLTRDGVYLVEGGEVTGTVNNFRFNESPVAILDRFSHAGATAPTFSREWGDYFPRTAMPPLRVPDFNMSSVSEAT